MNFPTVLVFLFVSLNATAQGQLARQSVDDDGQRLVVEFDIEQPGESRRFRGTYAVSGWNKARKQALLRHLVDSLHLPREAANVALIDGAVPWGTESVTASEPVEADARIGSVAVTRSASESLPTPEATPRRSAVGCPKDRPRKAQSTPLP